jgi:hypothetical protein
MNYIDANVFIYPLIYDLDQVVEAQLSKSILSRIAIGDIKACTSCLTWDEIVYVVSRVSGSDDSKRAGYKFLLFPNLRILGLDRKTLDCAQALVERYDLRPRDSIHAASAIQNKASSIVTNDDDFDVIEELWRIGLDKL